MYCEGFVRRIGVEDWVEHEVKNLMQAHEKDKNSTPQYTILESH
jgi:hypothetical protein